MAQKSAQDRMNTEVDLVAFISLLSVCICFLLLTTIWIQIGSLNVKQAFGGEGSGGQKQAQLWVNISAQGDISLQVENARVAKNLRRAQIKGVDGQVDQSALKAHVEKLSAALPQLNQAMLKPEAQSVFENMVQVMDAFRKAGLNDIGVVPL